MFSSKLPWVALAKFSWSVSLGDVEDKGTNCLIKAGQALGVFRELPRQDLGDFTAQVGVLNTIDFSPAALADLL